MKKTIVIVIFTIVVVCTSSARHADALMMMKLTNGLSNVSITDNGAGDISNVEGLIVWSGAVGAYNVNVSTGSSKPVIGSTTYPQLSLVNTSFSSSVAGAISVEVTDNFFGPSIPPLGFNNTINSAFASTQSVTYQSFIDTGNVPFGQGQQIASMGPSAGVFNNSAFGSVATSANYSLTLLATLTQNAPGLSQFDASLAAVPEPGTIALLGIGLAGLAGVEVRRRRKKKAVDKS